MLLNADTGEGYPFDADIIKTVDIANIACGGHAGDTVTMRENLQLVKSYGKQASAHIGYPDRDTFGRISINYATPELIAFVSEQLNQLLEQARITQTAISFIKPHGALYHDLGTNSSLANTFIETCANFAEHFAGTLNIIGAAESELFRAAKRHGLLTVAEAFIDRRYSDDGRLLPRSHDKALITNSAEACEQALSIATRQSVTSHSGSKLTINAQTLCVHGDTKNAVEIAAAVAHKLKAVR